MSNDCLTPELSALWDEFINPSLAPSDDACATDLLPVDDLAPLNDLAPLDNQLPPAPSAPHFWENL